MYALNNVAFYLPYFVPHPQNYIPSPKGSVEDFYLWLLPYMGVAAILVM